SDPGGEEGARQRDREDQPGDERGGRSHDGQAERGRCPEGEADPLPAVGREGRQPADDEPERPAGAVRLYAGRGVGGDVVGEAGREGARRLEVTSLKLTLEYDGTEFVGWQVQPEGRSVQQELEKGIARLLGGSAPIRVTGAGRTDAGV